MGTLLLIISPFLGAFIAYSVLTRMERDLEESERPSRKAFTPRERVAVEEADRTAARPRRSSASADPAIPVAAVASALSFAPFEDLHPYDGIPQDLNLAEFSTRN